ncbi:MAG: hypothetical protein K5679_09515 [Lachnospiraceae bacterium]|nr:hypothetical protein [Lachnospiraceae bacterium]
METDKEKLIGKLIYSRIPIEWIRFNMYLEDDVYRNIPMLVFRVQNSCSINLINRLKECVDTFNGKLNWKLFKNPLSKNGNYIITISELETLYKECYAGRAEYNPIEFFGMDKYKKYCDYAVQDIPNLAKHLDDNL